MFGLGQFFLKANYCIAVLRFMLYDNKSGGKRVKVLSMFS